MPHAPLDDRGARRRARQPREPEMASPVAHDRKAREPLGARAAQKGHGRAPRRTQAAARVPVPRGERLAGWLTVGGVGRHGGGGLGARVGARGEGAGEGHERLVREGGERCVGGRRCDEAPGSAGRAERPAPGEVLQRIEREVDRARLVRGKGGDEHTPVCGARGYRHHGRLRSIRRHHRAHVAPARGLRRAPRACEQVLDHERGRLVVTALKVEGKGLMEHVGPRQRRRRVA
mmetsp:Transcript_22206/g.69293  ORF Transcript_22206/g.69293 Transcript_22206/m.69293 type:complete len:233 (+) Transcript_22206:1192-1890(+)